MLRYSWYTAGKTPVHRASTLTKLIFTTSIWILSLAFQHPLYNGLLVAVILVIILFIARISWNLIKPFVAVTVPLSVLFAIMWSLAGGGKSVLASWTIPGTSFTLSFTGDGLTWGLMVSFRLLAILFSTFLLMVTTYEGDIIRGLLAFRVPYILAFTLLLATRLVGVLSGDLNTILEARKARGLPSRAGPLDIPIQAASLVIPLLMVSFRRVQTMTNAIEMKAFSPGKKRTIYRRPPFTIYHKAMLVGAILFVGLVIFLRLYYGFFALDPSRL